MKIIRAVTVALIMAVFMCTDVCAAANSAKKAVITTDIISGTNLIPQNSSNFNSAVNAGNIKWEQFSCNDLELAEGYDGKCLKTRNMPYSWSSPAFNLLPYISSPGKYSVQFSFRFVYEGDSVNTSVLIRGTKERTFIVQHGGNYFGSFSKVSAQSGVWYSVSFSFDVAQEDLNDIGAKEKWLLCLGTVPVGNASIEIDDLIFVKGETLPEAPDLSTINADAISEANEAALAQYAPEPTFWELFPESINKTCITVTAVTAAVAAAVIALKIYFYKKRGNKQ